MTQPWEMNNEATYECGWVCQPERCAIAHAAQAKLFKHIAGYVTPVMTVQEDDDVIITIAMPVDNWQELCAAFKVEP